MPFILIQGTFHVVSKRPDGDTLRFKAKDKRKWNKLEGPKVRLNARDEASLRIEAIDALETHYPTGSGEVHQPSGLANAATDVLLSAAGIRRVVWNHRPDGKRTRVRSARDGNPGYILSRTTEKYNRPVCFVFEGNSGKQDGSSQFLDVSWLRQSANHKLAKTGMAYPTYYDHMCRFTDLRDELTRVAKAASASGLGVWAADKTSGVVVDGEQQLMDEIVVMPKLFRRLITYLKANNDSVIGFREWLKQGDDELLVLSTGLMGKLHNVIEQRGKGIELTTEPWDLVFKP